jgi:hypothetical protein
MVACHPCPRRPKERLRAAAGVVFCVAAAATSATGCIGEGQPLPRRQTEDDAGPTIIEANVIDETDAGAAVPTLDPHSVLGVDPPHGPFTGGQRATVRGTGFGGDVAFWFGDAEVAPGEVVAVSPTVAQVTVPPGPTGPVDVTAQNGSDASTRRTLHAGYVYDAFSLSPNTGPTSGGTVVTLQGQETSWGPDTQVYVDLVACTNVEFVSETELRCATPAGTTGSKSVRVRTGDGNDSDVLDAFTYVDSNNGFRGGLSGDPLDRRLTVLVLDDFTGEVVPAASVVLDDDLSTVQQTDAQGLVVFESDGLGPARTVTIAKSCFQPVTFVQVPVDTVTAYLEPVLSPLCAEQGDPPPVGGTSAERVTVEGELVWRSSVEFTRQGWTNVPPPPSEQQRYVAYVFRPTSDPTREFSLPSASSAITLDSEGTVGYAFTSSGAPGNLTLYALGGIENRQIDPPMFIAYTMGVARGILAPPGESTTEVFIPMNIPIDHALTLQVDGPTPTARGPDRVLLGVSVSLGEAGYAVFPLGARSELLPVSSTLDFVGLPPLSGALLGSQYTITADAVTGEAALTPRSVVGMLSRSSSGGIVEVGGFVEVPLLQHPSSDELWDGHQLSVEWAPGGREVDVILVQIQSGYGLVNWTIAAPSTARELDLPALAQLDPELDLKPGPIQIVLTVAHIEQFDYGLLRYRHLAERGWDAFARDVYTARYAP